MGFFFDLLADCSEEAEESKWKTYVELEKLWQSNG